ERALIAAFVGGLQPVLCLTKTDLADPEAFAAEFRELDVPVHYTGISNEFTELTEVITGEVSALIGHSGVGKSTMVNRLVPDADRETGDVSGRSEEHTSELQSRF